MLLIIGPDNFPIRFLIQIKFNFCFSPIKRGCLGFLVEAPEAFRSDSLLNRLIIPAFYFQTTKVMPSIFLSDVRFWQSVRFLLVSDNKFLEEVDCYGFLLGSISILHIYLVVSLVNTHWHIPCSIHRFAYFVSFYVEFKRSFVLHVLDSIPDIDYCFL